MTENIRLSVSKTKTFNQCRKMYEFSYLLKLPKKDHDYHTFGKLIHRVLEAFHNYYIEGCLLPFHISMNDAFKLACSEFKDKMTPEMKKECWDIINHYLRLIGKDKQNNCSANVIACEKRFEIPIGKNIILNGAIDRIQLDDDNVLHLGDYKSTKNKKYLSNDWFQLMTYGFVMLRENPDLKKIRGSYILLRHNFEYITKEFSVDELLAVEQQYIDYAEQILTEKEFVPTPTNLCAYCDFLEHCPVGREKVNSNPSQSHKVYGEIAW